MILNTLIAGLHKVMLMIIELLTEHHISNALWSYDHLADA